MTLKSSKWFPSVEVVSCTVAVNVVFYYYTMYIN